ncbi:STAS domain-containing protein [Paenarthrobacter ilicis]|uniref:Anti-anti-sigma factor n=1 Tax=Paenarthrobacter ilicis TaxID=43665 RepID=A0ABX0TJG5_9MICC|nr:STAS domain-containing protein [Paenarthrobacter ilicis]MBM7792094.1 anti-anti-sigma factor [Paenarthrobacter ilicis]NIJ01281.1 anti-anti-sigma factor [Paenarthrobacter ilicis]
MSTLSPVSNTMPTSLASLDLTLTGALDAATVLAIRHDSATAATDGPIVVLLDVAAVTTVGASGVVGLLEVLHVLRARGGDLRLFGTSEALENTRLQAHLGQVARIYGTREEAVDGGTSLMRARHLAPKLRGISLFARRHRTFGWG